MVTKFAALGLTAALVLAPVVAFAQDATPSPTASPMASPMMKKPMTHHSMKKKSTMHHSMKPMATPSATETPKS